MHIHSYPCMPCHVMISFRIQMFVINQAQARGPYYSVYTGVCIMADAVVPEDDVPVSALYCRQGRYVLELFAGC